MYLYLFKIDCYSEDDISNLKQDDLNILMSNPGNKGSWYSISTESNDFDKWDISFDKMSVSPADTSEDLKCSYDEAEESYTFLVALKSDEILCEPPMISNVVSGTAFESVTLLYPALINGEETVCYEQWIDEEWDEGYMAGGEDMSCVGDVAGEIMGISPMEEFINPENYS